MNVRAITAAALAYFAVVFAAGFALGTIRVLWLVPRLGLRAAELAEMPLMLLVSFFAARWAVSRFRVGPGRWARLTVGLAALACLLAAELTVATGIQGLTIHDAIASRDPVSGTAYAASLVAFALMPLIGSASRRP